MEKYYKQPSELIRLRNENMFLKAKVETLERELDEIKSEFVLDDEIIDAEIVEE